jgi:hypothetical protein
MNGLYVAVKYTDKTLNSISEVLKLVPNPVQLEDIHTTIIYSRKYAEIVEQDIVVICINSGYDIWKDSSGKRILVMKLDSPQLEFRHRYLTSNYGLTYDYENYIPHITLSYDIGDDEFDLSTLPRNYYVVTSGEYNEELRDD